MTMRRRPSYWWCEHVERAMLLTSRLVLGDERTADLVFERNEPVTERSVRFTKRHSNQLSSLLDAKFEPDEDE